MRTRNLILSTTAALTAIAPVAAQAAPVARAAAPAEAESELGGSNFARVAIIVLIAAAGMLALILSDNDDDESVSA